MAFNEAEQYQRAQALDMALRTPGVNTHNVMRIADAYRKFITGEPSDNVGAVADNVETITFDQFVQYGRDNGANIINGMPWSFKFRGHPVTHESDSCYLIMGEQGQDIRFMAGDQLVINPSGSLATIKAERPEPTDPMADDSTDNDKP